MNKEEARKALISHKQIICMDCMHPQMVGWCENYCGLPEALQMAINALDDNNKWILCTDYTPKDNDYVFVTVVDDSGDNPYTYVTVAQYYERKSFDDCWGIWIADNDYLMGEVIAWMSKPLSYKKDSTTKEGK